MFILQLHSQASNVISVFIKIFCFNVFTFISINASQEIIYLLEAPIPPKASSKYDSLWSVGTMAFISFGFPIVKRTRRPESLTRLTTSPWVIPIMSVPFTAIMRSPIFNSSQRSAGLSGMIFPGEYKNVYLINCNNLKCYILEYR